MLRSLKLFQLLAFIAIALLVWFPLRSTIADSMGNVMFGDPLPGLSPGDLTLFEDGKDEFAEIDDVEEGLGPLFNARGCGECHSFPTTGGSSAVNEVRFGRYADGVFDDLASEGGSLLQLFAIEPKCQELLPSRANRVGQRQTTPLFGAGLIEAIPDSQILHYASIQSHSYPEQAGRVHFVTSVSDGGVHVGRFGWKAQQALLLDFSGDAYVNEMGITNILFPHENAPNGNKQLLGECDAVADPEDQPKSNGLSGIENFANFMRFLAPPPRGTITNRVRQGEFLFSQIGCAVCHRPFFTAASPHPVINGQTVPLYSDLLLHDVGTGDQIALGDAGPNEFRTPPLWGLRASSPYLHGGSAATPLQAIQSHGKQADLARKRFNRLSPIEQEAVLAFLNSL